MTYGIGTAEGNQYAWIYLFAEQNLLRLSILTHIGLLLLRCFHLEALDIRIIVIVGIVKHGCPYLVWVVLLDDAQVCLEVIV